MLNAVKMLVKLENGSSSVAHPLLRILDPPVNPSTKVTMGKGVSGSCRQVTVICKGISSPKELWNNLLFASTLKGTCRDIEPLKQRRCNNCQLIT